MTPRGPAGDRVVPVLRLGRAARRALAGASRWEVLARFRRSFYARDAGGRLVCLGPPAIGAGPLNAIAGMPGAVRWDAADVAPGTRGESDGSAFRVGRWVFSLDRACPWAPRPLPAGWDARTLERGLARLAAAAATRAPADGLGRLIPILAAGEGARVGAGWRGVSG